MRTRGFLRKRGFLKRRRVIAIACEGSVTERIYFEELKPGGNAFIQLVPVPRSAQKSHPKEVLADLARWAKNHGLRGRGEGWIVIDREDEQHRPSAILDSVCANAARQGYHVAVSNPCFELWLWLHLRDNRPFVSREQLKRELKRICPGFESNDYDPAHFIATAEAAVERASRIDSDIEQPWPRDQGSRVYLLVEKVLPHRTPVD